MSECVLKTLACRGLHVGPSKYRVDFDSKYAQVKKYRTRPFSNENDTVRTPQCYALPYIYYPKGPKIEKYKVALQD